MKLYLELRRIEVAHEKKMKHLFVLLVVTILSVGVAHAVEKPTCLKFAGKEKCGYGCVQSTGEIYCGEKPGMTCLTIAGKTKCGFDCKEFAGKVECGSKDGDNCVVAVGQIKCGQACHAERGQIKCGIDKNSNGRNSN